MKIPAVLLLALLATTARAAAPVIDEAALKRDTQTLASDAFEGASRERRAVTRRSPI